MSGEFLGTYSNSVNKNKWITIPANFKKKFSSQAKQTIIITLGPETNIVIYPLDIWNHKKEILSNGTAENKELLMRLQTFANSEQKLEKNGRVKIDNELLEIANINNKVIIKGEGNFISVWNPAQYKEYRANQLKQHKNSYTSIDYQ